VTPDVIRIEGEKDTSVTDWTKEIDDFLADQAQARSQGEAGQKALQKEAVAFLDATVLPAFKQLKANLERPGRDRCVDIQHGSPSRAQLTIGRPAPAAEGRGEMMAELQYAIALEIGPSAVCAMKIVDDGDGPVLGPLHGASIGNLNQTLIVNDVLRRWREAVRKQSAHYGPTTFRRIGSSCVGRSQDIGPVTSKRRGEDSRAWNT
jgi:hypothetical protein